MTRKLTETFVNNLRRLAQRAQADFESARRKGVSAAKLNQLEVRWIRKSDRAWEAGQQLKAQKKNPGMFGPDAVAKAKRVTKIRRVRHRDTGQLGEIIGSAPQGWVKVKWDNRDKATLIKRSEIALARGKRNPLNAQVATVRTRDGKIKSVATSAKETDRQLLARVKATHVIKRVVTGSHGVKNPSRKHVIEMTRARLEGRNVVRKAFGHKNVKREAELKARIKRAQTATVRPKGRLLNPALDWKAIKRFNFTYAIPGGAWIEDVNGEREWVSFKVIEKHLGKAWLDRQLRKQGQFTGVWVNVTQSNPKREAKTSKDAFGVTHENPKREFAANRYRVVGTQRQTKFYLQPNGLATGFPKDAAVFNGPDSATRAAAKENNSKIWGFKWKIERFTKAIKANPSVTAIAEKFQGKTDGAIEEFHAASSAPANLARAGKLVFLKAGKVFRLPGAMVAIAPNEKLWIVGKHAPMFETKAKAGERLDVGELTEICYETAKRHIGNGKTFEYHHVFGEDGGKCPHLHIDHEGMPLIVGGDYKIRAEGIVN